MPAATGDADLEVPFCVGDNLRIAGMVGGFNRNYSTADLRIMFREYIWRVRL